MNLRPAQADSPDDGGKIAAYKVNLMVTFVLEDTMGDWCPSEA
jgi:hypothetical protein